MKYVKTWVFAAVAAMALAASIGGNTALATVLCKQQGAFGGEGTGTTCPAGFAYEAGSKLHAVVVSQEEPVILRSEILEQELNLECPESTIQGKTSNEGEKGQAVSMTVEALTFLKCPNCEITMLKNGTVTVTWNSGTHNGTVTSSGTEMTTRCFYVGLGFLHCIYRTESTPLGTIVGGSPATLEVKASIPKVATDFFCSEELTWEGTYSLTEPSALYVAQST